MIEDGGVVETASKTIPILLQTVDLSIYPEGGDLVAGLANRVYIQALTPAKQPADLSGVVVDGRGTEVAKFATEHEGRGRFSFTPLKGEKYTLKIDKPAGIKTAYALPEAKEKGVVFSPSKDVFEPKDEIALANFRRSRANTRSPFRKSRKKWHPPAIELKGVENADRAPSTASADVVLKPAAEIDGVLVATIWDERARRPGGAPDFPQAGPCNQNRYSAG